MVGQKYVLMTSNVIPIKPGPSNTGPSNPAALVPSGGNIKVTVPGTLLIDIEIEGSLWIDANNVTVRNFSTLAGGGTFQSIFITSGITGTLLEDGEVRNARSSLIQGSFTARRLNCHESDSDCFKPSSNTTIEDCWIHNLGKADNAHPDGAQIRGGANFVFRGNNWDFPNPQPDPYLIDTIIYADNTTPTNNILIENNWLAGGGYNIVMSNPTMTGLEILNNRFTRPPAGHQFGVLTNTSIGAVICDNVWDDDGESMGFNNC